MAELARRTLLTTEDWRLATGVRLVLEDLAIFHHELNVSQFLNVLERVAGDGDDVGEGAGSDHADLPGQVEHLGGAQSRAADDVHGRHAEFDHVGEFLSDRFGPRDASHVGAEDDLHSGFDGLAEALFVNRRAEPVALTRWRVGRTPVAVVDAERGTVPGTLFEHLRDVGIPELEAVFDGVASAIESALQADSAVGVAGDFFAPAMRFVDDGLKLFEGERRLRHQLAVFANPRTVRHVDLDPVGAVVELFASGLAGFDGAIDDLGALRHG